MLAVAQSAGTIALVVVVAIVFYGVVGWVVLKGYRWFKRSAQAAQERAFEGLEVFSEPGEGRVFVEYGAYYGFLAFVEQTEHRFWASPDEARQALGRLHRCSLLWGLFAYGALIIPIFSFAHYWSQRRSIRRQEAALVDREFGVGT